MRCANGCDSPAVRYVDHYRKLGESRIYPEGKAGTGLVCEHCGSRHDEGYDAYEDHLATPPGTRELPQPQAAPLQQRVSDRMERAQPPADATEPCAETIDSSLASGQRAIGWTAGTAAVPKIAARWLGWLLDAILSVARRRIAR